jgi:hypothetical protein
MTMIALRQEKKLGKKRDLEGGSLIPWEEVNATLAHRTTENRLGLHG